MWAGSRTAQASSCYLPTEDWTSRAWFTLLGLIRFEGESFLSCVHLQLVALLDVPSQELFGQRILQVFFHSTAHRSSAVDRIVSLIDQKLDRGPIQVNLDIFGAYPHDDFCHLKLHNPGQVIPLELVEDDHVI